MSTRQPLLVIPGESPMRDDLYTFACAYAHSAALIEDHGTKLNAYVFAFPATVCQAFAIELFLKFFIVVDRPEIRNRDDLKQAGISFRKIGHSFSAMWGEVDDKYRNDIVETYNVANTVRINPDQFTQLLLDVDDNPFVKWRYVHEDVDVSFLRQDQLKQVTDALGKTAEKLIATPRAVP